MKVILYLLILIAFIQSCSTVDKLYGRCENGYYSCTQILLKKDSTFEYFIFYDVGGGSVLKGNWLRNKDTIVLNTYKQPQVITELDKINYQICKDVVTPCWLTNEKVLIKNNRLHIYKDTSGKINRQYFLRKTNMRNKQWQ